MFPITTRPWIILFCSGLFSSTAACTNVPDTRQETPPPTTSAPTTPTGLNFYGVDVTTFPYRLISLRGAASGRTVVAKAVNNSLSFETDITSNFTFCADIYLGSELPAGNYTIEAISATGTAHSTPARIEFSFDPSAAVIQNARTCRDLDPAHCSGSQVETQCNDGIDNNCDGHADAQDRHCGAPAAPIPVKDGGV